MEDLQRKNLSMHFPTDRGLCQCQALTDSEIFFDGITLNFANASMGMFWPSF